MSLKIISDRRTGKSKGYGFCVYSDKRQAQRAIEELDGEVRRFCLKSAVLGWKRAENSQSRRDRNPKRSQDGSDC